MSIDKFDLMYIIFDKYSKNKQDLGLDVKISAVALGPEEYLEAELITKQYGHRRVIKAEGPGKLAIYFPDGMVDVILKESKGVEFIYEPIAAVHLMSRNFHKTLNESY